MWGTAAAAACALRFGRRRALGGPTDRRTHRLIGYGTTDADADSLAPPELDHATMVLHDRHRRARSQEVATARSCHRAFVARRMAATCVAGAHRVGSWVPLPPDPLGTASSRPPCCAVKSEPADPHSTPFCGPRRNGEREGKLIRGSLLHLNPVTCLLYTSPSPRDS